MKERFDVLRKYIDFDVQSISNTAPPERSDRLRVRNQRDLTPSSVSRGDGQAHSIEGDGTSSNRVFRERCWKLHGKAAGTISFFTDRNHFCRSVNVSLDEMPIQARAEAQGALRVREVAVCQGAKRCGVQCFEHHVGFPPTFAPVDDREAASVHRNRIIDADVVEGAPAGDPYSSSAVDR